MESHRIGHPKEVALILVLYEAVRGVRNDVLVDLCHSPKSDTDVGEGNFDTA